MLERYRAFTGALGSRNKPYCTVTDPNKITELLKNSKSSVVICATDHYAIQVSQMAYENKIENVKTTGFDNCELLKKFPSNIDSLGFDRKELVNTIQNCLSEESPNEFNYIAHNIVSYNK